MIQLLALVGTLCNVISATLTAIGWYQIRKKNIDLHKKVMVAAAVFALTFFTIYMIRNLAFGDVPFAGPAEVRPYYLIFLAIHIILAIVAAAFGVVTLFAAFKSKFRFHKKIAPWTSVIWFITVSTGVMVYLFLFVIYPQPLLP